MAKFDFTMRAKWIGPHEDLNIKCKLKTNKTVLFAQNGLGKTFISRMFRLCDEEVCAKASSEDLVTKEKKSGQFSFSIKEQDEEPRELFIDLKLNSKPEIKNDTGYLFHVFNSDFVKDNLEVCDYSPSGDIQGVVVSREAIDSQNEEYQLQRIEDEGKELKQTLIDNINYIKTELKSMGIKGNLTEYKNFTLENILNMEISEDSDYISTKHQYEKLESIPDDVKSLIFPDIVFDSSLIQKTKVLFETTYDRAKFSDDFLSYVRKNTEFVKQGMKLYAEGKTKKCPFCHQSIEDQVASIISDYDAYLNDVEMKVIDDLKDVERQFLGFKQEYWNFCDKAKYEMNRFDQFKQAFDSCKHTSMVSLPSAEELNRIISTIVDISQNKRQNIEKYYPSDSIDEFEKLLFEIERVKKENSEYMSQLNKAIKKIQKASLSLRKKLCAQRQNTARIDYAEAIEEYHKKKQEYTELKREIREKGKSRETPKRELVGAAFESLIRLFFYEKYTFDTNTFCLRFNDFELKGKADRFLSEGEKTIIAFCYYLASIPKVIDEVEDYSKLFLIIDDPVSSMDFHYVYLVTNVIREIGKYAKIPDKNQERLLILTHNVEFFNIISRNKIATNKLLLSSTGIALAKASAIMPYEEHLKDIYEVAQGLKEPSHTIGNSIRHVLESLWRFERPDLGNLAQYCQEHTDLLESDYLYSICQDLSHGAVRQEYPYDDHLIGRSCEKVIEMMNKNFPGQIKAIENECSDPN